MENFNPEVHLDRPEQSALQSVVSQPGFEIIKKIGRACVDQFVVQWMNQITDEDVLRTHRHAKVAAQLYTAFLSEIKNQVDDYVHAQPQDKPIDVAASLDIGEYSDAEEEPLLG